MSKATKRKHVTKEAVDDYFVPEGDEEIVKIFASRGNNLHEVENARGVRYLVSMPTKFRRNIWVKRGDFVVTEPIKEGNKVQGEIVYILLAKQIKYLKNEKLWPKEFDPQDTQQSEQQTSTTANGVKSEVDSNGNSCVNGNEQSNGKFNGNGNGVDEDSDSESSDDDDGLFENPNHRPVYYMDESSEEDSSEGESEEEQEEPSQTSNNLTEYELEEGIAKVKLK